MPTHTIDTAAIESLRSFAVSRGTLQFAHMCTAALNGEEWALERIWYFLTPGACIVDATSAINTAHLLNLIAFTDTTRPDGAMGRLLDRDEGGAERRLRRRGSTVRRSRAGRTGEAPP